MLPRHPGSTLFPYTTLFRSSRARRRCAAKRTLHGEDRSEILDKRERGGPKWTAKMDQSLTVSGLSKSDPGSFLRRDRKSTRLNSSHVKISYAVFCLKKKKIN